MLKPQERYAVIEAWLDPQRVGHVYASVDVLDSDFVCHYADATGAKTMMQFVGAPSCPQLGRDLGVLYRAGRLRRGRVGLGPGAAAMGFPRWVYSYHLNTPEAQP